MSPSRTLAVVLSLFLAACGGSSTADGNAGAGGQDGGAGSGGTSGGGGSGGSAPCPMDLFQAQGKLCSPQGKTCGAENCTDPCQPCFMLQCNGGKWESMESFPDPNCFDAGGQSCGGFADVPCAADEYCDRPTCANDDTPGVCKKRPTICDTSCGGVCGCDGKGYCNECEANAAGVDTGPDANCNGDGGTGVTCASDLECQTGLKCCYPCGIPGCQNQCMAPMNGQCPLFP